MSPILFNIYIRELGEVKSNYGHGFSVVVGEEW